MIYLYLVMVFFNDIIPHKKKKQVLLHKLKEKLQILAFFTNHHMIIQQVVQLALYLLNIQVLTQTID